MEKDEKFEVRKLKFFKPMDLVVFLVFYSPVITAISIWSLSFVFQNFKGFIYLGFLVASWIIRSFFYMAAGIDADKEDSKNDICVTIQYSKYGNSLFSSFFFAFTIFYLYVPMFINNTHNFAVIIGLIAYFIIDLLMRQYKNCYNFNNIAGELFFNILFGAVLGIFFVGSMYIGGSSKYLFFNELSSTKQICSQPKEQTFKCQVYQNGELLGDFAP